MPKHDLLRIARIENRAMVHLKSWIPLRDSPSLLAPSVPAECRLLTIGPREWLLISDTLTISALHDHARDFHEHGVAAAPLSAGLATLLLEGSASRDVLSKSCGLDLHPAHCPVGTCTRTRLAQLPVIIHYTDLKPRFELYIGRSYLSYLQSWLDDTAAGATY